MRKMEDTGMRVDNERISIRKEIVFFVMSLSQPRCIKRVSAFRDAGYRCFVYGYRRGLYDVNDFPDGIEVNVFGEVKNGDYKNNYIRIKADVTSVYRLHGKNALYYAFGFMPSLFFAFKRVCFIYECSDVFYAYPQFDRVRWLLKRVDKWMIRKSKVTVMTSGGFADFFGLTGDEKVVVLPNRVSPRLKSLERKSLSVSNSLSFGFVGSIRYQNVFRFAEVIGKEFPQHSFHFYGGGDMQTMERVEALSVEYPNVHYHGKFKSPEDLSKIYEDLDIVVACYDNASLNERIAEPNKLYESLFFCKPIIVSPNTYLSKRVQDLECGFIVDANEYNSVKDFIANLSIDEVSRISENELHTPVAEIIDSPIELIKVLLST